MAANSIRSITDRLGWGQGKDATVHHRDNVVQGPVSRPKIGPPKSNSAKRISGGHASGHLVDFDRLEDRINYNVESPLNGTGFADYFAGSIQTVRPRKRGGHVARNKVVLVMTVVGLIVFWGVARFFWPS